MGLITTETNMVEAREIMVQSHDKAEAAATKIITSAYNAQAQGGALSWGETAKICVDNLELRGKTLVNFWQKVAQEKPSVIMAYCVAVKSGKLDLDAAKSAAQTATPIDNNASLNQMIQYFAFLDQPPAPPA